jgi:hypothetical protein
MYDCILRKFIVNLKELKGKEFRSSK